MNQQSCFCQGETDITYTNESVMTEVEGYDTLLLAWRNKFSLDFSDTYLDITISVAYNNVVMEQWTPYYL